MDLTTFGISSEFKFLIPDKTVLHDSLSTSHKSKKFYLSLISPCLSCFVLGTWAQNVSEGPEVAIVKKIKMMGEMLIKYFNSRKM